MTELTDKDLNFIGAKWHLNLLGPKDKDVVFAFARAIIQADRTQRQAEPQAKADIIKDLLHSAHTDGYTSEQQAFIRAIADRVDWLDAPPPAQVPAKWTPSEIANGCTGIRWVTQDGVFGRPTADDVRQYLAELPDALR